MPPTRKTSKSKKPRYDDELATRLRGLLKSHPITGESTSQTTLGEKLGVKQQTVGQWADGSTKPAFDYIKPISDYFGISVEELVTGVSPENKGLNKDVGLSNEAINILKELKSRQSQPSLETFKSGVIIEFLNLMIESIDTANPREYMYYFASRSIDYIVGLHKAASFQKQVEDNYEPEAGSSLNMSDLRNDSLEYEAYKLTNYFHDLIDFLTKNSDVVKRIERFYRKNYCVLPEYKKITLENNLELRVKSYDPYDDKYDWGKKFKEYWSEPGQDDSDEDS